MPYRLFADPGAIDVHPELDTPFGKGDRGVGEREPHNGPDGPVLDGVVDDAPLQFERNGAEQEYRHREQAQRELVPRADPPDIAENRPGQDQPPSRCFQRVSSMIRRPRIDLRQPFAAGNR